MLIKVEEKEPAVYSPDRSDLHTELEAMKKATGAKREEISRRLFARFCEFQEDLSDLGNFCDELGLSRELTEFVFTGLRLWADGGSADAALFVESKPGRPPKTERNQILFEDVRRRVGMGWDVHAACYASADALGRGEVEGLPEQSLSPSSIRRIYYAVMNDSDTGKLATEEADEKQHSIAGSTEELIDAETLRHANQGNWEDSLVLFRHIYDMGNRALTHKYMNMVGRIAGLNIEGLKYYNSCLKKIIDGQSPNEAFRYGHRGE